MDWSELVGTKVQLPPPGNELSQSNGQPPAAEPPAAVPPPAPVPAPAAKTSRSAKATAANRENPLFAGSAADPAKAQAQAQTQTQAQPQPSAVPQAPAYLPRPKTVSSLLTVPTLMNLTFATTVITLLWKLLQRWFGAAAGQWVPLVCCLVFAGISWIASYATARTNAVTKVVTLLVAVLTAFILTAAVIGIDVAVLQD
ncbi:hypothetical protein [Flindersiella endophytica]